MFGFGLRLSNRKIKGGLPSALSLFYKEGAVAKGSFADPVPWSDGAVLVVRFTSIAASSALTGDVQVYGPLYIRNGYLVARDGVNEAMYATTWAAGEAVNALIETDSIGIMRVGRIL